VSETGAASRMEGNKAGDATPTVIGAVKMAEEYLAGRGVNSPRLSAEHLLAKIMDCERLDLYLRFDQRLTEETLADYRAYLKRRAEHYPLQYLLGSAEFYSLLFEISEGVFIPRPETELLVEWIEEIFEGRGDVTFIEFGVGSGVIAGSLASRNPEWRGFAFDRSIRAAVLARRNFISLGVSDRVGLFVAETFGAVGSESKFDLLVSNPPYIPTSTIPILDKEVSVFEDSGALDGGDDGLCYYPRLAEAGARLLGPGGVIALEIGEGQGSRVAEILGVAGYDRPVVKKDYTGLERLVGAFRPNR
jgi:release factor glutamine methyltransferase